MLNETQGSARLQYGETMALAAVYGPAQPRYSRHEHFDEAVVEVSYNLAAPPPSASDPATPAAGAELARLERDGARQIQQILASCIDLKSCPRMLILIDVSVLRSDGAILSTAINACALALLDSGIPMLFVPMALHCLFGGADVENQTKLLCTSAEAEATAQSSVTFAFRQSSTPAGNNNNNDDDDDDAKNLKIVATIATGVFDISLLERAWAECVANSHTVRSFFSKVVRR